jgi:hypothetical protein
MNQRDEKRDTKSAILLKPSPENPNRTLQSFGWEKSSDEISIPNATACISEDQSQIMH